jgi:hypothetical protein
MSSVLTIISAVSLGFVVGSLITYFLLRRFQWHRRTRSPGREEAAAEALQRDRAQSHDINVHMCIPIHFHIQTLDGINYPIEFPGNLPVEKLLTEFILDASIKTHPREVVAWDLEDEASGRKLDLKKNLEQNEVKNGHVLRLVRVDETPQRPGPEPYHPGKGLTRCDNGHFCDSAKYKTCPYDAAQSMDPSTRSIRIGFARGAGDEEQHDTVPVNRGTGETELGDDQPTRRIGQSGPGGIDAVVGWLVCIHGRNRGRDYRIRSENNTVGRSENMDICISGDDLISRERHTIITFDPQQKTFYLSPAEGRSLVFLNNKAVLTPQQLKPDDEIMLGATKLRFVPFAEAVESYESKGKRDTANLSSPATRDSFRCSVFHPERIGPNDVGKIIAYVHLEIVASKVVADASEKLELSRTARMVASSESVIRRLPRCSTVQVTADVPGLLFENDRASMRLWEDMQSVEFRFKPAAGRANTASCGWIHFWLAGVLLADVNVTVFVAGDCVPEIFREQLAQANAKPYQRVFPSYSHRDAAVVERLEIYAASFGDEYLRDVTKLRTGQIWNEELLAFVKAADVFQLFWSCEAAASKYVEQEWRSALKERESRADPFFLRPIYWTQQPAPIPSELSHLHFGKVAIGD